MYWLAFTLWSAATAISLGASFLGYAKGLKAAVRHGLIIAAGILTLASLLFVLIDTTEPDPSTPVWPIVLSVLFAVGFGGPLTELVFSLASRRSMQEAREQTEPSPLRGGLWIGLLERIAIVASLWSGWPEGIAVVLAVKGLGRFSELKNHYAAEQFILGTFSSCLVAAGAYGLGLLFS